MCVCGGGGGGGGEGGGKVQIIGAGARGAKLFSGCKLIGTPPQSVPITIFLTLKTDNKAKLRTELKKYTVRNTFK